MHIEVITDNNKFLELAALVSGMYKSLDPEYSEFQAVASLMEMLKQPDFTCIGMFDSNNKLIGISLGYYFSKNKFYFSGFYVIMKNNKGIKKLIDFSFALIKEKGYTSWLVDSTNPNMSSIMEKYSAKVKHVQYEGCLA